MACAILKINAFKQKKKILIKAFWMQNIKNYWFVTNLSSVLLFFFFLSVLTLNKNEKYYYVIIKCNNGHLTNNY